MALTAVAITKAKSRAKPYKLTDGDGLFLYVTPNGGRYWRMNYRHLGKQKTLAFGVYPDTGLAEAREQRDAARKVLARGCDPAEQIKLERIAAAVAASNSFKAVADEWLVKVEREGRSAVTMKKLRWLLDFINESIGQRPITSITAQELLVMLRKMESKGRYETAKRLRSTASQIFRYAIATARAERDVAADLRGALIAPQPVHRAAITSANAAGGLLRAIEAFEGHPNTKAALRLLPHVFVRPGELRFAEWADFDFDKAVWTIPSHKTKMRRVHSIPLSRQALAIIETIEHDADYSSYLFPSLRSVDRPMSENTINAALRRMGFAQDEMTGHGFRAMAATLLNEMGLWHPDAIERQLAHCDNNTVRRAYTRGEYWDERVRMMQHWSDHLDFLRDGAKVIKGAFRKAKAGQ
ncbi:MULTISPECIES: integrase arm-type DNA-binding domain-containing protein [unclassified Sphingomonas]|uniref:tyrosine-type recombinase/integrase n=1 Tax=unclassified Sphingomonas TaxID=196159 RepID=UPI00092A8296|nr:MULTISPECIES: integrase arm-type DNA-binding domain-containing protein [unclassified Sphingomonas]MBN8849793.1 tyrosine-type recombinase/integrase [Sphingomonas sp.]OJV31639.1 MAG: integrase [Sphingomonas sp. 67-36]